MVAKCWFLGCKPQRHLRFNEVCCLSIPGIPRDFSANTVSKGYARARKPRPGSVSLRQNFLQIYICELMERRRLFSNLGRRLAKFAFKTGYDTKSKWSNSYGATARSDDAWEIFINVKLLDRYSMTKPSNQSVEGENFWWHLSCFMTSVT